MGTWTLNGEDDCHAMFFGPDWASDQLSDLSRGMAVAVGCNVLDAFIVDVIAVVEGHSQKTENSLCSRENHVCQAKYSGLLMVGIWRTHIVMHERKV